MLTFKVSTADGSAQCIERGKVPIKVVDSPVRVAPDLKISGHLLVTSVTFGKKPSSGVEISLFSQKPVKVCLRIQILFYRGLYFC